MAIQTVTTKSFLRTAITETPVAVSTVPAVASAVEQVVIVLNGSRKAERILPQALSYAREINAELVVIRTHNARNGSAAYDEANRYLKSVKNKLQTQYNNVKSVLFDGTNTISALNFVIDECKQTCVLVAGKPQNRLQQLLSGDPLAGLHAEKPNVIVQSIAV
jgi:K+-sensing histidine kinase KdpD